MHTMHHIVAENEITLNVNNKIMFKTTGGLFYAQSAFAYMYTTDMLYIHCTVQYSTFVYYNNAIL